MEQREVWSSLICYFTINPQVFIFTDCHSLEAKTKGKLTPKKITTNQFGTRLAFYLMLRLDVTG